jgi:arylsulfatase A-like enzyme
MLPRAAAGLVVFLFAACGSDRSGSSEQESATHRPPNILLVVVDTLRTDHLPVYGYVARPTAPALAAMAQEPGSQVVNNLIGCSSWTKPSMATLFTGLPPVEHGVMRLVGPGSRLEDSATLAATFGRAGFATGCVMSNHLLTRDTGAGFDHGFAFWDERPARRKHEGTTSSEVATSGLAWLGQQPAGQPWFLVLHFFDPHAVLVDHPGQDWFQPGYGGWVKGSDATATLRAEQNSCSEADRAQLGALYDEEVRTVDDAFGTVLAALRQRSDWSDTLVIFTADHGEELAERGLIGHTQTLHAELNDLPLVLRVPAGVAWTLPALPGGGHAQQQLYGAMLRAAGLAVPPGPAGSAGRGVTPEFAAAEVDFVPVFVEHSEKFVQKRAVVRGDFKLMLDRKSGAFTLFDRANDPREMSPLPAEHAQRAALEALLRAHPWWEQE